MRVVMVVGRSTGGIGTHVGQLAGILRSLGQEVRVVTAPATAEHFGWDGAGRDWPLGKAGRIRVLPRFRALLAASDVVHAHGLQAGAVVSSALLGQARRPALVISLHNAVLGNGVRSAVARGVERAVVRSADLVTGASSDLVEHAASLGARRTRLAPVPAPRVPELLLQPLPGPTERAALLAALLGRPGVGPGESVPPDLSELPLVLTISRIARQKNLHVLVDAARRLTTPVCWVVVGDGDPALLEQLRAAALGTGVRFAGAQQDVARWLRAATLFVLPSAWEARALAAQEAMAVGLPVIVSRVGGLPELVGDAGVLVPPGDAAALAGAVEALLADRHTRASLSSRAREVAATWDDAEEAARQWLQSCGRLTGMT